MRRTAPRRRQGFTLIEIVVAFMIFFMVITFSMWSMAQAADQALGAERARQLRMLAERKLAEIALFERHYDENRGPERFDDLPDELREQFGEWEWTVDVRDVTVFGPQKDENAPYLFGAPEGSDDDEDGASGGVPGETAQPKGDTQILRELVLKVVQREEDGTEGESIELVTYLPQVAAKPVGKPAGEAPK